MVITVSNARPVKSWARFLLCCVMLMGLGGCGLGQKVADGTVSATQSLLYKQVTQLHLEMTARSALNNNPKGAALSTVVQVYQLRDRKAFDTADYLTLSTSASQILSADLLAERTLRVKPGESLPLNMPMEKEAEYVAIVALFWSPEVEQNSWRLVLKREDLDPDLPRRIELNANRLLLLPRK